MAPKNIMMRKQPLLLNVLGDYDGQYYTAHCLEFDVVAQGKSSDEAFLNLQKAITAYIEFAIQQGHEGTLYNPAPREYWDKFSKALARRVKSEVPVPKYDLELHIA